MALRKSGFPGRILGVSSPATTEQAVRKGAIDDAVSLETAASEADLIYLARPVLQIQRTLTELNPWVKSECLVTDAGSTKAQIVAAASTSLTRCQFLGGHPMAGKENAGIAKADADLFRNRPYVLTPTSPEHVHTPAASVLLELLRNIGSNPLLVMEPDVHDRTVAFTSHLPQIASSALAAALGDSSLTDSDYGVSGAGVADMTRLALSGFAIWHEIFVTNHDHVHHALSVYIDKLLKFRDNLTTSTLEREFEIAAQAATKVRLRELYYGSDKDASE